MTIDPSFALAGAITGILVGLTGVGGGALMTPILLIFFGISPTTAIATDLWFAAITKLIGARVHHTKGNVDWQVAKRLWLGSLPIALLIILLIGLGESIAKVKWLTKAIGFVVLITAIGLLAAPKLMSFARDRRIGEPERFKAMQPALTVGAGAVLGLCVALTSVGAGALGSVMLLYLYPLRMTPHRLVATDIVHAIPLAVLGGLGYLYAGKVDGSMLISLLFGSIPSVIYGSFLRAKINDKQLRVALSLMLIYVGLKVIKL